MNQQNLIKTIVQAIRQSEPKTKAYDTQARVTRIDGSTAWVHIPGGVAETPVKLTIAAKAGDTVQVRVSGGRGFLVGNSSAPPTDDRVAKEAVKQVSVVKKTLTVVKEVAEKAQRIAGNTNQYFWHVESGTDTGAHITEIPQDEFLANPANGGGNLLARSNGIAARNGLTELATFGSGGATIGKTDGTQGYLEMDFHSIKGKSKEKTTYFYVGDLREANGVAQVTEEFVDNITVSGNTSSVTLVVNATEILHVYNWNTEITNYTFNGSNVVTLSGTNYDVITVVYYTRSASAKAYTLGVRSANYQTGLMSFAAGNNNGAEGYCSAVFGGNNFAQGRYSAAFGNGCQALSNTSLAGGQGCVAEKPRALAFGYQTIADGYNATALGYNTMTIVNNSFVCGRFNDPSGTELFVVGGGSDDNNRSNAFGVFGNGTVYASGTLTANKLTAVTVQSYTPTWASGENANNYHCVVSAGICSFSYQGQGVAHSAGKSIGNLPPGARPKSQVYAPFVKMSGNVVGIISISTAGAITVNQISNTTSTGRIYFNCTFPVV